MCVGRDTGTKIQNDEELSHDDSEKVAYQHPEDREESQRRQRTTHAC
jgi:hypothetical protein